MKKILVVDDDEHISDLVRIVFESSGYRVEAVYDGHAAVEKIDAGQYDLIILDIMLPKSDGWEICRYIRNSGARGTPVIMLTAKGEEMDKILGLELGADDYITKPFSPRELSARVKALLRRADGYNTVQEPLHAGRLTIDSDRYVVSVEDKEIELTPKEMQLLALMAGKSGKTFSREVLLEQIWGYNYPGMSMRTIDEHIKRLRSKLAEFDQKNTYIQTVWGVGYKFEVKAK